MNDPTFIEVEKLKRMQSLHVRFLIFDLRSGVKFQEGHIKNAFNLESCHFLEKLPERVPLKETPIVVYDENGSEAVALVREAEKNGYLNIVILEGGYEAFSRSFLL